MTQIAPSPTGSGWIVYNVPLGGSFGVGAYNSYGILLHAARFVCLRGGYAFDVIEPDSHDWYTMESAWESVQRFTARA
jgi:hypothetical protein